MTPKIIKDPLVVFLYQLLRDHLPAGAVEPLVIVGEMSKTSENRLTNGHLAEYVTELADRLRLGRVVNDNSDEMRATARDDYRDAAAKHRPADINFPFSRNLASHSPDTTVLDATFPTTHPKPNILAAYDHVKVETHTGPGLNLPHNIPKPDTFREDVARYGNEMFTTQDFAPDTWRILRCIGEGAKTVHEFHNYDENTWAHHASSGYSIYPTYAHAEAVLHGLRMEKVAREAVRQLQRLGTDPHVEDSNKWASAAAFLRTLHGQKERQEEIAEIVAKYPCPECGYAIDACNGWRGGPDKARWFCKKANCSWVARAHVLYQDGDSGIPESIKDINGSVALSLCKVCCRGESELVEPCIPPKPKAVSGA